MRLPCKPFCGLVVSTPSRMKRFSPAVAPSIVMPFDLASKFAPGACVTTLLKSRPLGSFTNWSAVML